MKTLDQVDTITAEDRALLSKVKEVIHEFLPTATVLLYGSVARGTQEAESDYDILVLSDESLTTKQEDRIRSAVFHVEIETGAVLSTQFFAKGQWDRHRAMPFRIEVDQDGILL